MTLRHELQSARLSSGGMAKAVGFAGTMARTARQRLAEKGLAPGGAVAKVTQIEPLEELDLIALIAS